MTTQHLGQPKSATWNFTHRGQALFNRNGEAVTDSEGARWSRVVDAGGREATRVDFACSTSGPWPRRDGRSPGPEADTHSADTIDSDGPRVALVTLVERLRGLDPRVFAPVLASGQDGDTAWLVFDGLAEELSAPGPLASADLVTLGATLASALKLALDKDLPVPRLEHLWFTHDYDDEGTYRPRVIGVGVPGSRSEPDLCSDLGRLLILAFVGRPGHLQEASQPVSIDLTRSRGAVLASDLCDVLDRAVGRRYDRLVDLRRDLLAATALSSPQGATFRTESLAGSRGAIALGAASPWQDVPRNEHERGFEVRSSRRRAVWRGALLMALVAILAVALIHVARDTGAPTSGSAPIHTPLPVDDAASATGPAKVSRPPESQPSPGGRDGSAAPLGPPDVDRAGAQAPPTTRALPAADPLVTFEIGTIPERALIHEGAAFIGHTPYRLTVRRDRLPMQLRLSRAGFQTEALDLEAPRGAESTDGGVDNTRLIKLTPLPRPPTAPIILDR